MRRQLRGGLSPCCTVTVVVACRLVFDFIDNKGKRRRFRGTKANHLHRKDRHAGAWEGSGLKISSYTRT